MLQALRKRVQMEVAGIGTTVRAWWDLPCDVEAGLAIDISRIDMYHLGFTFTLAAAASIQTTVELGITTVERDWNLISTTDIPRPGLPGTIAQMYDEIFIGTDAAGVPQAFVREKREEVVYFAPPLRLCQSRIQAVALARNAMSSAERWEIVMWFERVKVSQQEALWLHDYWSRTDQTPGSLIAG